MMKTSASILLAFLALLLPLSLSAQSSSSAAPISIRDCCHNSQDATAFALIYGYPLFSFAQFAKLLLKAIGSNKVVSTPTLSTPANKLVVKPNVDTLYTVVFIDLSKNDLVVTIPEIPADRYWVFPFYDPYGDQFATISQVQDSEPGDYLIRRADDANVAYGQQAAPPSGELSKYKGIINYPTNYGILLGRILVLKNTTADLSLVHSYQKQVNIQAVNRTQEQYRAMHVPELTTDLVNVDSSLSTSEQVMELLARLAPYNQPSIIADRYRVAGILGMAGISPVGGNYSQPSDVDLSKAEASANATVAKIAADPDKLLHAGNQWLLMKPQYSGNFGPDYPIRNFIAKQGYLELVPTEALYPVYTPEAGTGTVTIGANEAYLFTFYGVPPIAEPEGFWSLTAYGSDQYLIENPLGRYEIGDRSNITYSDGSLVYPSASQRLWRKRQAGSDDTRQFQVLLQPLNVQPPANWTSNWLPAPAGGGEVAFLLRWYAPTDAFLDGSYEYPKVEKIPALR